MGSALDAQGLSKRILDDVWLRVESAERFVILGPSGAGKTTLLRLLAGLELPNRGRIEIGGIDVTQQPAHERSTGFVFQQGALFSHLSVFENLAFPLRLRSMRGSALRARVLEFAQRFGLESLLECSSVTLSGGERQRAAIARALISDPHVLLLDEPLAHLDPGARSHVRQSILEASGEQHRAVVLVTHDHEEALSVADRLAVLIEGRIAQCDVPARIYERPASVAVARFFGAFPMNVLADAGHALGYGAVTVGIRPQDISINNGVTSLEGQVTGMEYAGHAWMAHVATSAGALVVQTQQTPRIGERLRLHFQPEKVYRFDPHDGALLS
ncbi:MAG: ABC transporter ATP-binding protein [Vulcanimicrobiaceae bacterium]